ncbi:MAG: DUF5017 domain-containing protein [Flavobacteriaceae bacterium]|jgi:hypothetical protein|nr:DUF5017 domain-containing protein [Flavobacteriaceae bacterium]MBT4113248.1 DUF5017 domain-containing protein [Flavobacteriaceae bacterium]MBT4614646.1 DUF5017 domain-containing protein [Flavobacteriaceae bacterium]MBT5247123.1 DUF5017 domain-containing protein [Flavobacteriaceae bacterium]MBT5649609.1 DUF5017 domain-containing protein [Flavobacteriaceae bacterium]
MKLIKAIILITFLTAANFSCVQDDDFSIPESIGLEENQDLTQLLNQINNGAVDLMTISQVKSFFVNGEVTLIESNIVVKGYVVSSDMTGNFYKEFYMQDEPDNPTAGIKVVLNQVDSYNQFNIGREIYIKLQNLYIGETNSGDGVITIGGSINQYGDEVEEITENMAVSSILRSSNTFDIIPLSLNLSEINDSHIGIFVTAQNAQFSNFLSGLTYVDPYDDYDTQRDLESCVDSGSIKVETSAYASFQDNLLPTEGSGTLSAVVTKSYDGDDRVMMLNSTDDVTFSSSRCDPLFYDNFSGSLNNWHVKSVQGEQGWEITPYGNPAPSAKMSGFSGGSNVNEDWLITTTIDLSSVTTASLTFQSVVRYNGPSLTVHMSPDYNGGDPTSDGNWTELSVTLDTDTDSWSSWTDSGNIDLSSVTGGNVYIAFKYVSTTSGSATYEIDNVLVMGE